MRGAPICTTRTRDRARESEAKLIDRWGWRTYSLQLDESRFGEERLGGHSRTRGPRYLYAEAGGSGGLEAASAHFSPPLSPGGCRSLSLKERGSLESRGVAPLPPPALPASCPCAGASERRKERPPPQAPPRRAPRHRHALVLIHQIQSLELLFVFHDSWTHPRRQVDCPSSASSQPGRVRAEIVIIHTLLPRLARRQTRYPGCR